MLADQALQKVFQLKPSGTVLDIGCGSGDHAREFLSKGYQVTGVDIIDPEIKHDNFELIDGLYHDCWRTEEQYDIIWISHVLEHVENVAEFLALIQGEEVKKGSLIAITVPPMKHNIVGGHVNFFNAGLLIYRMVLAGFNMRNCRVKQYGYNISVIVEAELIELPKLKYDCGDIETLAEYFPEGYNYQDFNGDIRELNWE